MKTTPSKPLFQRLTPKFSILSALALSVPAALCRNTEVILAFLFLSVLLTGVAGIPLSTVKKRLLPLVGFLAMIWVFLPLTFGGETMATWKVLGLTLDISGPGVAYSMAVSIKSVAILLVFIALLAPLPIQALGFGLQQLRVPEKLIFLFLMSHRYIYVIKEEYDRLLRAARFRGFQPGTNVHSYRTYAHMTGMLFVRAFLRAGRVHKAMRCRGFNGRFHTLDIYPEHWFNAVMLTLAALAGPGLFVWEHLH